MKPLVLCVVLVCSAIYGDGAPDHDYHRSRSLQRDTGSTAVNPEEIAAQHWYQQAQDAIAARRHSIMQGGSAKNIIMFLGDGLSVPTLAAARTLQGQRQGLTGEESSLYFENFPITGLSKTYCVDSQIADSACTSTAYLCGVKANRGTIGLTAAISRYNCTPAEEDARVNSIAAWAIEDGKDAGIVTSTRVTHASPSGAFAHIANRDWESDVEVAASGCDPEKTKDIAYQLVNQYPGNRFKVILGGGKREFLPNSTIDELGDFGKRLDERNLIEDWKNSKTAANERHQYVYNKQQLRKAAKDGDHILGLFASSHLEYNLLSDEDQPSMADMTEAAIRTLSKNPRGFFLFVEGGRIDHAHHDNYVHLALDETIELSKAVERAAQLTSAQDTLMVLTSDHAHVMSFNGYTHRGGDILGASDDIGDDDVPYMTLSYGNGPGSRRSQETFGVRTDVTKEEEFGSPTWRSHAEVPLESETHGGDDVAVFARGPQQHMFTGMYEQSQIPHLMAYAACIGPGQKVCDQLW